MKVICLIIGHNFTRWNFASLAGNKEWNLSETCARCGINIKELN